METLACRKSGPSGPHREKGPTPLALDALDDAQTSPKRWVVLTPEGRRRTFYADDGEIVEGGALLLWRNSDAAWGSPRLVIALAPSAWIELHCTDDDDAAASELRS